MSKKKPPHTRIYWHTCQFTGKPFCSKLSKGVYSPEGLRLRKIQVATIKQASRNVCRVYFYYCPVTLRWFTTRTPNGTTPESKEANRISQVLHARARRQIEEVKERDRQRMRNRKEYNRNYQRQWYAAKKARAASPTP